MKSQEVFIRFMAAKSANRRNSNLIAIDYSYLAIIDSKRLITRFQSCWQPHHMSHYLLEILLYMCVLIRSIASFSCAIICPCCSLNSLSAHESVPYSTLHRRPISKAIHGSKNKRFILMILFSPV